MILSIIVAMDEQGVIGVNGGLPWRLSSDMKHFKNITMGKPIVMGRKTHESIGKALPGRENIVITRDSDYKSEDCIIFTNLDYAIDHCADEEEVFIIGGAQVYNQAIERADRIYLTEVHTSVEGDTYFLEFDRNHWKETNRESFDADEKNDFSFSFVVLEKI